MGQRRTRSQQPPPPEQQTPAQEAALTAAALALIAALGLERAAGIDRIAESVLAFIPSAPRGQQIARLVASLAVEEIPVIDSVGFARAAQLDRLMWRVAYMGASSARLARGLAEGVPVETLIASETRFLEQHLRMNARRLFGARDVLEAMERWGEVLSWRITRRPTNRPYHLSAEGMNWRPLLGPPIQTLAYPGVLDNCLCKSGPPVAGAQFLAQLGAPLAA